MLLKAVSKIKLFYHSDAAVFEALPAQWTHLYGGIGEAQRQWLLSHAGAVPHQDQTAESRLSPV